MGKGVYGVGIFRCFYSIGGYWYSIFLLVVFIVIWMVIVWVSIWLFFVLRILYLIFSWFFYFMMCVIMCSVWLNSSGCMYFICVLIIGYR